MPPSNRPHALYRFYDDTGALLYVGITHNPGARFPQHEKDKPWWNEVRGISIEQYPTRDAVLAAEQRAIRVENPRYNIQRPTTPKRATGARARIGLVWICEACRKPVADGTGYIHVNMHDVGQAEHAVRAWAEKHGDKIGHPLAEYLEWPDAVRWQAHHATCDPRPDAADYWFGVERARTHAHLLNWTAHLMEKTWLEHTDWSELIDRMAGVDA